MTRQSGITSAQMKSAPQGTVFIWCNAALSYPQALARHIDRADLRIVAPGAILAGDLRGARSIVVDHAADLTDEQLDGLDSVLGLVNPFRP